MNNDKPHDDKSQGDKSQDTAESGWASLISAAGYILAISYPVLALSTGARAIYQLLFRDDITYYLPALLSALAATCYLVATIGFVYRRRWTWWLSLGSLGLETVLTLVVGTLSYIAPEVIGRTVWRHFGADYGYFPLFQPVIGLVWLLWPPTMAEYGVRSSNAHPSADIIHPSSTAAR